MNDVAAEGPQHRHGVPVLRALPVDDGAAEHHLRHGVPRRAEARSRIEALERVAKLLQIEALLDRKPSQLSGGQRQRVAMGRALVRDPLLFLFDEPLSNLDAKLRVEMRMEIKRLHQRIGSTIVYVTHDQIEAMTLATPHRRDAPWAKCSNSPIPTRSTTGRPTCSSRGFMGAPPMNTLPARLMAEGGRLWAVLGDGARAAAAAAGVDCWRQAGREVVLGIRPECIAEQTRRFDGDPGATLKLDASGGDDRADRRAKRSCCCAWAGTRCWDAFRPDVRPAAGRPPRASPWIPARSACSIRRPSGLSPSVRSRVADASRRERYRRRVSAAAGGHQAMVKCASVGFPARPLIGSMSCGQAENAITRSISARSAM